MLRISGFCVLLASLLVSPSFGANDKLTFDDRVEIVRGLMAEYATAKVLIPRSKKHLDFMATGKFDKPAWEAMAREVGPAARAGDMVQVTKVEIEDQRIIIELNGGAKSKRKWYHNIEVGMGTRTTPINQPQNVTAPAGTTIALIFDKRVPVLPAAEFKKMLAPVLDFERRSATEQLVDSFPPEIQAAVREKRAIEGMDREQVLLALGRPRHKQRESKDGEDYEDWVYGLPPGKITFVTFKGSKVAQVKESYAGLGGQTAPPLTPR
ncbi:MAG TPA: hypothetical protein VFL57_21525 [Bryobacteraceae bacterium]|nr:hypothetical protein [Bryobacteraceae bacterium]